jgi:ABC-2 type transport system ATP-binding protein
LSVKVEQLSKVYGEQKAVDHISFEVKAGEITGFLGPNGAGKTTTMKMLTCYIPQTEGRAWVAGYDINERSMDVRRNVGYLPEHNPLYLDMYVKEYLYFVADIYHMGSVSRKAVDEIIEKTGLTLEHKKHIGELSKGYRQRVGLAQAMLHNPKVLILDEPTSGLDPNQIAEIRHLIREIGKERTVILSTHIMQEVEALCDRVIIIDKGRIVADDITQNLQNRMGGESIVHVEFREKITEQKLRMIDGVEKVRNQRGNHWTLVSPKHRDIREEVFRFCVQNNLVLLGMSREEQSLESVFHDLTGKKQEKDV